jgi:DUF971 family protein
MPTDLQPVPTELRLHKDRKTLTVAFDSGETFDLPAEYLRVRSPSAEVQGHSAEERKTVGGKRNVMVVEVLPVGNYAVRLMFDDLHSTGIYSWDYLRELGRTYADNWRDYLDELAAKNMTRDPPPVRRPRRVAAGTAERSAQDVDRRADLDALVKVFDVFVG